MLDTLYIMLTWLPITLVSTLLYTLIALFIAYHHYTLPNYNTIKGAVDLRAIWHTRVIGHRGARLLKHASKVYGVNNTTDLTPEQTARCLDIPENSLASIVYAADQGADGVEVDVQMTADGHCLVMHDDTVDRMLNGSGQVHQMKYEQIAAMQYKSVGGDRYIAKNPSDQHYIDNRTAPTLEQVIQLCQTKNLLLMIELKEVMHNRQIQTVVAELFERYQVHSTAYVATFNPVQLYQFRQSYPSIPTCLLYSRTTSQTYHRQGAIQMQPYWWLNVSIVRTVLDWLMYTYSATYVAQFIGTSMIGPEGSIVSAELCADMADSNTAIYVWVCNHTNELLHLQHNLGICVATDWIYSSSYKNAATLYAATALVNALSMPSTPTTPSNKAKFDSMLVSRMQQLHQHQQQTIASIA